MGINWGELSPVVASLVVLAVVSVALVQNYRKQAEPPTLPAEALAKIIAASVAEAVKPFHTVVDNNTEALNEMRIALAEQKGMVKNVLGNTELLLQRHRNGSGDS